MITRPKSFLDLIIPKSVFDKEEVFNYILLYTNNVNDDTKAYYETKILNSLTDSELLSILIINVIFRKNDKLLLSYISDKYFKFNSLVIDNIVNELEESYLKTHIDDFDFDNYVKNFTDKDKFNIVNLDTKNTILIVDDEYIKYMDYVNINGLSPSILSNVFNNLNKDIYDNGVELLLKEVFHNSDVPSTDNDVFYKLNSFIKEVTKNN
jgi:hypothetical protein